MSWKDIALPLVSIFEGCEKKINGAIYPYLDTIAKPPRWTRGYGRTNGITESSPPITKEDANRELEIGLTQRAVQCITLAPPLLEKQACLAAVTSWAYNCGTGAFRCSRLRRSINAGRWRDAAREIKTPRTAGGKLIKGLARRRDAEYSIFLSGVEDA
jgi:lysozyme